MAAQVRTRQKALNLDTEFQLQVQDTAIPKPQEGEILVRVTATALNPGDWKIQRWGIKIGGQPLCLGMDMAGVVEDVGRNVHGFQKGDRVITMGTWTPETHSFQEFMRATARFTARVPDSISDEEAASVPVGVLAAWIGLYNNPYGAGHPHPLSNGSQNESTPQPLLVLGGSSSVGQYVLQFAKLSKFSPIITTASLRHDGYLRSLGATHVLDRHLNDERIVADIKRISNGPLTIIFDAISSTETKQFGYDILATGGKLITCDTRFGEFTRFVADIPDIKTDPANPKEVISVRGVATEPKAEAMAEFLFGNLSRLLEDRLIVPNRVEVLRGGLHAIIPGLARLEDGSVSGVKLVVRPQDTV